MLTVITPAKSTDLTTADRAQALLGFPEGQWNVVKNLLIPQASRAIVGYCRRSFGVETVREHIAAELRPGVVLSRSPVVSEVQVEVSGRPARDDERFIYDARTGRFFRALEDGTETLFIGPVSVTYTAGYVLPGDATAEQPMTLPENVERAAIQIVGAYLSLRGRDPTVKSETIEGVGATSWWVPSASSPLPDPEAVHLLAEFRRFF